MSRKFKPDERQKLLSLFDLMDTFGNALTAQQADTNDSEEEYQFAKRLAQV